MYQPTLSTLNTLAVCPGSGAMWRVGHDSDASNEGNAVHEHLAMRARMPIDLALEELAEVCARWNLDDTVSSIVMAQMKNFEWMPPGGSIPELGLCLFEDGTVGPIKGGRGYYPNVLQEIAVVPGTIDLIWSEPRPLEILESGRPHCPEGSTLWVIDYKRGSDTYVRNVEANLQVLGAGVLAGRYTGAESVNAGIVYVRKGRGDWDTVALGQTELGIVYERIRGVVRDVRLEQDKPDGAPLRLNEGPQCEFCAARPLCPAKLATLKALVTTEDPHARTPLTMAAATRAAIMKSQIDRLARAWGDELELFVKENGPIDLGNGTVWGKYDRKGSKILAPKALPVLREELGAFAENAISISSKAIDEAVRAWLEDTTGGKKGIGKAKARVFGKLGEAGAILATTTECHGAHVPTNEKETDETDED